jgi:hypothetical protein
MEENKEFKNLVASIKELEQQLLSVEAKQLDQQGIKIIQLVCCCVVLVLLDILFILGKQGVEVERQIKEHFAQCVNTLAARQETLLQDLHEIISKQSM